MNPGKTFGGPSVLSEEEYEIVNGWRKYMGLKPITKEQQEARRAKYSEDKK